MTQNDPQVPWTCEQWARVNQVIQEEAQRARVAATFLPLYGPLPAGADFVRQENIAYKPLKIHDKKTLLLSTLQMPVQVRGAQLADPEMRSVLALFRRAANVIARLEDALSFNGYDGSSGLPYGAPDKGETISEGEASNGLLGDLSSANVTIQWGTNPVATDYITIMGTQITFGAGAGDVAPGVTLVATLTNLLAFLNSQAAGPLANLKYSMPDNTSLKIEAKLPGPGGNALTVGPNAGGAVNPVAVTNLAGGVAKFTSPTVKQFTWGGPPPDGNVLVDGVIASVSDLEGGGHFGPFAVVLAQDLFQAAQTPTVVAPVGGAATPFSLPSDRILPFLGGDGKLLRSSALPLGYGVVVALGGEPIELVVAKDMSLQFLQVTQEPIFVFRVYERMALLIKDPGAIVALAPS